MWMPQQSPFQKDLKVTLDLSEEFKDRVGLMGFPLLMLSELKIQIRTIWRHSHFRSSKTAVSSLVVYP